MKKECSKGGLKKTIENRSKRSQPFCVFRTVCSLGYRRRLASDRMRAIRSSNGFYFP